MIIGTRIEHNEKTFFEYYRAARLAYNCYGPIKPCFDMVAAKYSTDKGTYWSYGKTIADARRQTLSQMSLQWVLNNNVVTSALIGASRPEQIVENIGAISGAPFTKEELDMIDKALL